MSNIENDGAIYAWNPDSRGRQDAGAAGRGELNQRQYKLARCLLQSNITFTRVS
jgi:hypothetical protein